MRGLLGEHMLCQTIYCWFGGRKGTWNKCLLLVHRCVFWTFFGTPPFIKHSSPLDKTFHTQYFKFSVGNLSIDPRFWDVLIRHLFYRNYQIETTVHFFRRDNKQPASLKKIFIFRINQLKCDLWSWFLRRKKTEGKDRKDEKEQSQKRALICELWGRNI